jgi:hypothetical protein
MKIFNIGMVLDWAKGQCELRQSKSVIVEKALQEYVELKKMLQVDTHIDKEVCKPEEMKWTD